MQSFIPLDKMVKEIYYNSMETKEDYIKAMTKKLLRVINKHSRIEAMSVRFDEGIEVTPKEIHTIQAIGERKKINVTDLGAHFGVTKSAASQIVTKLVKKGFVKKEVTAHSKKELDLSLTKLGWRAFRAHEIFHGKHLISLFESLDTFSLSQIMTTLALLEVIESVLDDRLSQLERE